MKYQGCLLAVKDMSKSKYFYEKVLHQTILMDIGVHVTFDGLSLQEGYSELIGVPPDSVKAKSHNFQVYFEVEDLDAVYAQLKTTDGLEWVHELKEYPWGQRNIRVYDPDGHVVEIAEGMKVVVQRFLGQGMSVQQIAKRTMLPVEYVSQCADSKL